MQRRERITGRFAKRTSAAQAGSMAMAQGNRIELRAAITETMRFDVTAGTQQTRMQPTAGARAFDLRGSWNSGQVLAGTGALVFEGEVLEGSRTAIH
jgi:hypothetical protein